MGSKRCFATYQILMRQAGTMNVEETLNINTNSRSGQAEGSKE